LYGRAAMANTCIAYVKVSILCGYWDTSFVYYINNSLATKCHIVNMKTCGGVWTDRIEPYVSFVFSENFHTLNDNDNNHFSHLKSAFLCPQSTLHMDDATAERPTHTHTHTHTHTLGVETELMFSK